MKLLCRGKCTSTFFIKKCKDLKINKQNDIIILQINILTPNKYKALNWSGCMNNICQATKKYLISLKAIQTGNTKIPLLSIDQIYLIVKYIKVPKEINQSRIASEDAVHLKDILLEKYKEIQMFNKQFCEKVFAKLPEEIDVYIDNKNRCQMVDYSILFEAVEEAKK